MAADGNMKLNAESLNVFIGRQPILNGQRQLYGYELLFRSNSVDNHFNGTDGDAASFKTMNNALNVLGLTSLTGGRKAFINITRKLLVEEAYSVLPPDESVIEILETVMPDAAVIHACMRMKDAGYMLALDDFVFRPGFEPLLDIADFIKVDFIDLNAKQRAAMVELVAGRSACLLAEKVETQHDFQEALNLGYSLFQGYFFCKPEIVSGRELPPVKRQYLRFLQEAMRPNPSYATLEQIVKEEPSLSVKLLRYLNSAMFGLRSKVDSIKQALAMLGDRQIRQWASLVALTSLGDDKPTETLTLCLIRAKFCEELCPHLKLDGRDLDLFFLGLLSGLDGLVDRPISEMLSEMPVAQDVKAALMGSTTLFGTIYGLVLACERGRRSVIQLLAGKVGIPEDLVLKLYLEAIAWADTVLHCNRDQQVKAA